MWCRRELRGQGNAAVCADGICLSACIAVGVQMRKYLHTAVYTESEEMALESEVLQSCGIDM